MPQDLYTWDGDDLQIQGDGTGVAFSIGDAGGNDSFNVRVGEHNFSIASKRTGTQVGLVAELETLVTTNLSSRIVHVAGQTTLGDTGAGHYLYYATGKTGVTIDGFNFVTAVGVDDYFKRLDSSVDFDMVADYAALFALTAVDDEIVFVKSPPGVFYYDLSSTDQVDGVTTFPGNGGSLSFSGGSFTGTAGTGRWITLFPPTDNDVLAVNLPLTAIEDGEAANVVGYNSAGDAPIRQMVYHASGRPGSEDGGFTIFGPGVDDWWEQPYVDVGYATWFGVTGTGDQRTALQALIDGVKDYGRVVFDVACEISDSLTAKEGQSIEWTAKTTLNDGGSVVRMISCNLPNITLINPQLDMDQANNTHDGSGGTQSAVSNYGTGSNLRILGGTIENAIDNGYQGGRDGLLIEGTTISGSGEHAVYINGIDANGVGLHADGLTLRNVRVDNVGQLATPPFTESHGIQVRNCNSLVIENPVIHLGNPGVDSFYFLLDNVKGARITGGVGSGCNHTGMFCDTDAEDILLSGFRGSWTGGGGSKSYVRATAGTNVVVQDCEFDGFQGNASTSGGDLVERTKFINLPSQFYIVQGGTYRDCEWTPVGAYPGSSILRLEQLGGKLFNCTLNDDIVIGVWIRALTGATSVTIDNCSFPDHNGNRGIYIEPDTGESHVITNNSFPSSTSPSTIEFDTNTAYTGTHRIDGNTFGVGGSIQVDPLHRFEKVIPEQFGAVGDGVTDDSTAITNADAAAASASIELHFTAGKTYLVTGDLTMTATRIIGNGAVVRASASHDDVMNLSACEYVEHLIVDGGRLNGVTAGGLRGETVRATGATNLTWHNVTARNAPTGATANNFFLGPSDAETVYTLNDCTALNPGYANVRFDDAGTVELNNLSSRIESDNIGAGGTDNRFLVASLSSGSRQTLRIRGGLWESTLTARASTVIDGSSNQMGQLDVEGLTVRARNMTDFANSVFWKVDEVDHASFRNVQMDHGASGVFYTMNPSAFKSVEILDCRFSSYLNPSGAADDYLTVTNSVFGPKAFGTGTEYTINHGIQNFGKCRTTVTDSTFSGIASDGLLPSAGNVYTFDSVADVDPATDNITITGHVFYDGQAIEYGNGGGTSIAPLVDGTTYYVIWIDADNIQLAATKSDALTATQINITADGVGASHTLTGLMAECMFDRCVFEFNSASNRFVMTTGEAGGLANVVMRDITWRNIGAGNAHLASSSQRRLILQPGDGIRGRWHWDDSLGTPGNQTTGDKHPAVDTFSDGVPGGVVVNRNYPDSTTLIPSWTWNETQSVWVENHEAVTPEMFGAVGDDSSAAAIAANDAAFAAALLSSRVVTIGKSQGGGTFGEVEYYLSAPISIPQHHSLIGPGWRRARLVWDTTMAAGSAVILNGTNTLQGVSFFGPDDASKHGLYIQNESHGRNVISDCHFGQWEDGVRLHRAQITSFYSCYITGNTNGVHFINNAASGEGTDGSVNACLFEGGEINTNAVGVLVHGGTNNSTFRSVAIQGNTSKGVRVYGPEVKRSLSIDNCYLESNGTHHIHLESDAIAYRTRIENNGFLGSGASTTDKITLDQSFGAVVKGNYYTDDLGDDIVLASAARDSIIEMGWRDQIEPVVITGTGTRTRWVDQDTEATAAQLTAATNAANTVGKHTGRQVWDSTNGRPVWASGSGATDVWVDHAGTTVHTPV